MTTIAGKIESEAGRRVNVPRPLTHPLDLGEEGLAVNATRTCSINGCSTAAFARSICQRHYDQVRKNGTLERHSRVHKPMSSCAVPDCDKDRHSFGYCSMHARRHRKHGDPSVVLSKPRGPANCRWQGDNIGYTAAHDRLRVRRGSATKHRCVDCGGRAREWSYSGRAANEQHERTASGALIAYSTDITDYDPRCTRCHRIHDGNLPHQQIPRSRARDFDQGPR